MKNNSLFDAYLPVVAEVIDCIHEARDIFNLQIRFKQQQDHLAYNFIPGQFNMIYLYGVGEVAISIASDPADRSQINHTIRAVGRVTKALQKLTKGDYIGIRGPFGNGWPIEKAIGKDIIIVTGGLGCAPTLSVVKYIMARRSQYGKLHILQGVKHSNDFIFRQQYKKWQQMPNTIIHIAADKAGPQWPWNIGLVTDMLKSVTTEPSNTIVMMCGPEGMMHTAVQTLTNKGIAAENIYLSMERNMECAIGHCGHCQYGGLFICKDGPVFSYPVIKFLFNIAGF